jgi:nucleotide sugar dehydrogenase
MPITNLISKITSNSAVIGVVGIGYVGLPLIIEFLKKGYTVHGFDVDQNKINTILEKKSYIKHIPSEKFSTFVNSSFFVHSTFENIKDCDAVIICVPTPLNKSKEPDLSYIISACNNVAPYIREGTIVSLESTTYPGTTKEILIPILFKNSALEVGRNVFVVFSPEREDPGNPIFSVSNIPKVVGGIDPKSLELGCSLYRRIIEKVVPVSSTETAEITKLFENIYRTVNIALVNELKMVCQKMGINIWEVIEAAKTKPFGFHAFYPSPGCGGHCLTGNSLVFVKDNKDIRYGITIAQLFKDSDQIDKLKILSWNQKTNKLIWDKISAISEGIGNFKIRRIYISPKNFIEVTEDHPMLVYSTIYNNYSCTLAKDVQLGDDLALSTNFLGDETTAKNSTVMVHKILEIGYKEPVYSVEVEENHNFVTSFGVIVHNCLPCDPAYLSWRARQFDVYTHFIDLALELNTKMAYYTVSKIREALDKVGRGLKESQITIIGVAYKKDSDDLRDSPALKIMEILTDQGAFVRYYDPYILKVKLGNGIELDSASKEDFIKYTEDCAVIITDHSCFDYDQILKCCKQIVDTRGVYALKDGKPAVYPNVIFS